MKEKLKLPCEPENERKYASLCGWLQRNVISAVLVEERLRLVLAVTSPSKWRDKLSVDTIWPS